MEDVVPRQVQIGERKKRRPSLPRKIKMAGALRSSQILPMIRLFTRKENHVLRILRRLHTDNRSTSTLLHEFVFSRWNQQTEPWIRLWSHRADRRWFPGSLGRCLGLPCGLDFVCTNYYYVVVLSGHHIMASLLLSKVTQLCHFPDSIILQISSSLISIHHISRPLFSILSITPAMAMMHDRS